MRTNALSGVIYGVVLLTVSAYFDKWYLPGNYLMKLRVEELWMVIAAAILAFVYLPR